MAFSYDYLIKMDDVRTVLLEELAGKVTTVELIHILFELKKYAFPPENKADEADKADKADETDEEGGEA